eukprot:scaffold12211_cov116-Isochrysis_galbana.AAC.2
MQGVRELSHVRSPSRHATGQSRWWPSLCERGPSPAMAAARFPSSCAPGSMTAVGSGGAACMLRPRTPPLFGTAVDHSSNP